MVMFHCYVSLPEGMSENRGPQNLTDLDGLSASAPVEGLFFLYLCCSQVNAQDDGLPSGKLT